jgi:hypothetical protein
METTTIDRIEELTTLEYDKKENDKLNKKYKPRTTVEALQGFYNWSKQIINLSQALSVLLGSGIAVMFYQKMPSIGWLLVLLSFGFLAVVEALKRFTVTKANEIRIVNNNQDKAINNRTYNISSFALVVMSMGISYVGTPYVISFFASHGELTDLETIALTFEQQENKHSSFWNELSKGAQAKADSIHENNNWLGVTVKSARPAQLAMEVKASSYLDSLNSKLAFIAAQNHKAVQDAIIANNTIIEEHKAWCYGFSWIGCMAAILIDLLVLGLCRWNANFDERKIKENAAKDRITKEQNEVKGSASTDTNTLEVKDTPKVEETPKDKEGHKAKDIEKQEVRPITLGKQEPKEGDIEKGEGKKRDRVLVEVAGNLRPMTFGQINTLIAGQSTSERIQHLENLKNKLK